MREALDIMKTALRVLTAVSDKRAADPTDIDHLEAYGGPKPQGMDLDEYTCGVIQEALKKRATKRARGV